MEMESTKCPLSGARFIYFIRAAFHMFRKQRVIVIMNMNYYACTSAFVPWHLNDLVVRWER